MEFIFEKEKVEKLLSKLTADAAPRWGLMTAQHMLEHLVYLFRLYLEQKTELPLLIPLEKVPKAQASLHDMTRELPIMIRPPFLPSDALAPLVYPNLESAKDALLLKMNEFMAYFEANPEVKRLHPFFGEMDKTHWYLFHSKHFYHHFKQFGLVD